MLVQTHTYRVDGVDGNSLGLLRTTTCTLEFPIIFQQQFIVCEHILCLAILGLDYSYNYLIGIVWFSTNHLHLHQGPWSIVISDPTLFSIHVNQISTLVTPHMLVKTISQFTMPART